MDSAINHESTDAFKHSEGHLLVAVDHGELEQRLRQLVLVDAPDLISVGGEALI